MQNHAKRPIAFVVIVTFGLLSSGCYDQYAVRPAELPKLNGSYSSSYAVGPNAYVTEQSVARVEGEDGRLLELRGQHDVIVTLKSGKKLRFEHPVDVQPEGQGFVVRSGNSPAISLAESDVEKVEVTQLNSQKSMAAVIGGTLLAGLVLVGGIFLTQK